MKIENANDGHGALCKAREAREMLGCSDETLRVLRELHPELAVELTGRGRYWYSVLELNKLKINGRKE